MAKEPSSRPCNCANVLGKRGIPNGSDDHAGHRATTYKGGSPTVTILGYKEWLGVFRPPVKIYVNGKKAGEVKRNETKTMRIDGPCKLTFKCFLGLRPAECHVNGGELVLLSVRRTTSSLRVILTDENNVQSAILENRRKDRRAWVVLACAFAVYVTFLLAVLAK